MTANCPECNSNLRRLKRRNYPMFTEDGTRTIEKTYSCEMCNCEYLKDGTEVELDRSQTITSGNTQGYHKTF